MVRASLAGGAHGDRRPRSVHFFRRSAREWAFFRPELRINPGHDRPVAHQEEMRSLAMLRLVSKYLRDETHQCVWDCRQLPRRPTAKDGPVPQRVRSFAGFQEFRRDALGDAERMPAVAFDYWLAAGKLSEFRRAAGANIPPTKPDANAKLRVARRARCPRAGISPAALSLPPPGVAEPHSRVRQPKIFALSSPALRTHSQRRARGCAQETEAGTSPCATQSPPANPAARRTSLTRAQAENPKDRANEELPAQSR